MAVSSSTPAGVPGQFDQAGTQRVVRHRQHERRALLERLSPGPARAILLLRIDGHWVGLKDPTRMGVRDDATLLVLSHSFTL